MLNNKPKPSVSSFRRLVMTSAALFLPTFKLYTEAYFTPDGAFWGGTPYGAQTRAGHPAKGQGQALYAEIPGEVLRKQIPRPQRPFMCAFFERGADRARNDTV